VSKVDQSSKKQEARSRWLFPVSFILELLFEPEAGCKIFLQNVIELHQTIQCLSQKVILFVATIVRILDVTYGLWQKIADLKHV
jgi:hypothetical protein